MRAEARPPRRKWPWIVAGAAVAALVVAGGVWYVNRPGDAPTEPTAAPSASPSTSPVDVDPTGCLGGDGRDAAMVLAAQTDAPHTSNGAVDFAASFVRWVGQYPVPNQDEAKQLQAAVIAPTSTYDLPTFLAGEPNLSGGLVPNGTDFYMSTVPGVWNLESYSDNEAVVSVGTGLVIEGALHPTFRTSAMYKLSWGKDGWMVEAAMQPRPTEQLFPMGTGFTEGC